MVLSYCKFVLTDGIEKAFTHKKAITVAALAIIS